jgi:hypothetical protein
VLSDNSVGAQVGSGGPPATAAGIRVDARINYPTLFARVLGSCCENVAVWARSRAMLKPLAGPGTGGGGPFIVCGGTASGNGAYNDDTANVEKLLIDGTNPAQVNYADYQGQRYIVHWSQLGQHEADCDAPSNSFKGNAEEGECSPTGASALPCTLGHENGTRAGPARNRVAGLPSCTGTQMNNCVSLLPIANACDSTDCNIVAYAPFLLTENGSGSGCSASNCHTGKLLGAAMVDGNAGTGPFNTQNPGAFTMKLEPDG